MPKPQKPVTEVVAAPRNDRRQRRKFSAKEKARILSAADKCTGRGDLGELLRREGIFSSHLSTWRAQRAKEGLLGLEPRKPGRRPTRDDKDRLIEKQQRQIARMEKELRIQKALLELQEKAHEILGIALPRIEDVSEDDSSSSSDSATRRSR